MKSHLRKAIHLTEYLLSLVVIAILNIYFCESMIAWEDLV